MSFKQKDYKFSHIRGEEEQNGSPLVVIPNLQLEIDSHVRIDGYTISL